MTDAIQQVIDKITEMTASIQALSAGSLQQHQLDQMTVDFKNLLDEHKAAVLDSTPVRTGEFQSNPVQRAVQGYTGKYARELSDIANHGEHKIGNWKLRGTDLILAKMLIDKANDIKQIDKKGFEGSDKLRPASRVMPSSRSMRARLAAFGVTCCWFFRVMRCSL